MAPVLVREGGGTAVMKMASVSDEYRHLKPRDVKLAKQNTAVLGGLYVHFSSSSPLRCSLIHSVHTRKMWLCYCLLVCVRTDHSFTDRGLQQVSGNDPWIIKAGQILRRPKSPLLDLPTIPVLIYQLNPSTLERTFSQTYSVLCHTGLKLAATVHD